MIVASSEVPTMADRLVAIRRTSGGAWLSAVETLIPTPRRTQ